MRTSSSMAGRLIDDASGRGGGSSRFEWGEVRQLPPPRRPDELPPLRPTQNACYEALTLALTEGQVFAALTGPAGSGKTTVLEAVFTDRRDRLLRCIRIPEPDKVPAALAEQIEQVAYAEASKPENLQRHVVLAIDDAHLSSPELLTCLSRLAAMREPGRRVPQVLLVGRPELWGRLAETAYEPLARRVAIRATLPAVGDDSDPWEAVADDVKETMTGLRSDGRGSDMLPPHEPAFSAYDFAEPMSRPEMVDAPVPPSGVYALFPDPPPAPRRAPRETKRRLLLPMTVLLVGLVGCVAALSLYDWPDVLGDMPWSEAKPATPFVLPRSLGESSHGLPMPPPSLPPTAAVPRQNAAMPPAAAPAVAPKPAPAAVADAPAHLAAPVEPPKDLARPIPPPIAAAVPTPAAPPQAAPPAQAVTSAAPTPSPASVSAPVVTPTVAAPPVATPTVAAPPVAAPALAAPSVAAPSSAAPSSASLAAPTPLAPSLLTLLLHRGDEQVAIGDISAARLLYERVAESGSAIAARQLARTYDPAFLTAPAEAGLADPGLARKWYGRAAALGDADAITRLKAFSQGQ